MNVKKIGSGRGNVLPLTLAHPPLPPLPSIPSHSPSPSSPRHIGLRQQSEATTASVQVENIKFFVMNFVKVIFFLIIVDASWFFLFTIAFSVL